jgi:hypothetical protein
MSFTKRLVSGAFCGLLSIAMLATPALANDELSAEVSTGFLTDYIFRGRNLYDGTSIQPKVVLGYDAGDAGVFTATARGRFQGEGGISAAEKFNEVDYLLDYTYDLGTAALSVGHIFFTFPDSPSDWTDTNEVYAAIALDLPLSPKFTAYHDYDEADSQYYTLDLSNTVECPALGDGFNFTPYVQFGFASNADKVYVDDGLVHTTFGVTTDLSLGDIAVIPSLNYTAESDDVAENEFFAGTTFSYSF